MDRKNKTQKYFMRKFSNLQHVTLNVYASICSTNKLHHHMAGMVCFGMNGSTKYHLARKT